MSLFSGPVEHFANPPETWVVEKSALSGQWLLKVGEVALRQYGTKKAAEADKVGGPFVSLYEKESRWYNGEPVPGWKPYEEVAP